MAHDWFVVHDGLVTAGRFPARARAHRGISAAELLLLCGCGATAAVAVGFAKLGLGIPGHSIVLAVLPIAFGLSLAPRRLAGTAALLSALGAVTYGSGAIVSLSLIGPAMDVALRRVRGWWRLYLALVLAGMAANLLALGSRAATKLLGFDLAGARPFDSWWLQATVTYTLSGMVAGLLGALCWFHFDDRRRTEPPA